MIPREISSICTNGEDDDGDGWTDNLLRRVRARSEGVDPTIGPEPSAADPDTPGAPSEADPGTRRDPRPVLVTFEDLQGAPAPVAAADSA